LENFSKGDKKMKKRLILVITLALLANGILNRTDKTSAQQKTPESKMYRLPKQPQTRGKRRGIVNEIAKTSPGVIQKAFVQENNDGNVTRVTGQIDIDGAEDARDAAEKFLASNGDKLGIARLIGKKDLKSGLRAVREVKSLTGTHFIYNQFYQNLPVFDEEIKVSVNNKLKVTTASSNVKTVSAVTGGEVISKAGDDQAALKAALAAVGGKVHPKLKPEVEKGIINADQGDPTNVYRVHIQTISPSGAWEVVVDAETKRILRKEDIAKYAAGKGMVFKPNPIISSGRSDLQDNGDADSPELTAQRKPVQLNDLNTSGNLSGTYASTHLTHTFERAFNKDLTFEFTRSDERFEEVMAYHWVTESSRYLRTLGYTQLLNRQIPIDVNGITDANAFYSSRYGSITFGTGGVDTAEDATDILHEYGHALLDAQSPGLQRAKYSEAGAIHEGFGDYWAASFFADSGQWNNYMGSWFAVGMSRSGDPPFLRRLDNPKKYPVNLDPGMEPHRNGEIWAAALWDIFNAFGRKKADILILESNFRLPYDAKFSDAARAIITTNRDLPQGVDEAKLADIFVKRGILNDQNLAAGAAFMGQIWEGTDSFDWNYTYTFSDFGSVRVRVVRPDGEAFMDSTATYSVADDMITVRAFSGLITQVARVGGQQFIGKTIFNQCIDDTKVQKLAESLNAKAKIKRLNQVYDWKVTRQFEQFIQDNKKWKGEGGSSKFEYEFLPGGKLKVVVDRGESPYIPEQATYEIEGNTILIVMDDWIYQFGTFDGSRITGITYYDLSEDAANKAPKILSKLKTNKTDDEDETWIATPDVESKK
jgi:Zn-dependent metalloprotease